MRKHFNQLQSKFPFIFVTILFSLSIWLLIRGFVKYVSIWLLQIGFSVPVIPFIIGDPLQNPFLFEFIFSCFVLIIMWLISTKVKFYQELKMRVITISVMVLGIIFQYLWNTMIPIYSRLIPYIIEKQNMIFLNNYALEEALFSNTSNLMLFLLSLPTIITFLILVWLNKLCNEHWKDLIEHLKDWEFPLRLPAFIEMFIDDGKKLKVSKKLREVFDEKDDDEIPLPDIAIGPNTKTREMVIQRGKDRTLNNLIIGAIGTGKTSALVLPILNQDLHHMTYMINNFKKYYEREDYHTEDVKGRLLNGISVIEPSKDLCDKAYQLVKAHGIPDEAVFYVDPTNPDTPSLNLFQGPTDKVAETFTMVLEGIGEKQEFFFQQSQRSHLKHHIYLLKEHDPDLDLGFEDLINMYNDPQLVAQMHQKLKERIAKFGDINSIEDRDERNQILILKGISDWFDATYVPVEKGFGKNLQPDIITEGPYRGQQRVQDTKAEHVVGLRNILNDIASNILLRRVLFGKSEFDFDKHLEYGGILLVNTAKGELSNLSDVLGKFVLLSLQNAVFRRKPNVSPYHHILVDEFPDYLNEDFASFPAQSRKYKAIITVVAQTVSQLQRKYGPDFMTTLIAVLRNKFIYGDTTQLDAQLFSDIFGERIIFEETDNEQEVSPMFDDPSARIGKSYRKTERANLTPSEIIYQDAFVAAVKLVENNKPIPAQQVRANFVPRDEFKKAEVTVDGEAGRYWLEVRRNFLLGKKKNIFHNETSNIEDIESVIQDQDIEIDESLILPTSNIKKPLQKVNYNPTNELIIDQSLFENESNNKAELEKSVEKQTDAINDNTDLQITEESPNAKNDIQSDEESINNPIISEISNITESISFEDGLFKTIEKVYKQGDSIKNEDDSSNKEHQINKFTIDESELDKYEKEKQKKEEHKRSLIEKQKKEIEEQKNNEVEDNEIDYSEDEIEEIEKFINKSSNNNTELIEELKLWEEEQKKERQTTRTKTKAALYNEFGLYDDIMEILYNEKKDE